MEKMEAGEKSLLWYLQQIVNFRRKEGRFYPLGETLWMMVMNIMSDYSGYREINCFVRQNKVGLVHYLHLSKWRVPSSGAIRTILLHLDFEALNQAFTIRVSS